MGFYTTHDASGEQGVIPPGGDTRTDGQDGRTGRTDGRTDMSSLHTALCPPDLTGALGTRALWEGRGHPSAKVTRLKGFRLA